MNTVLQALETTSRTRPVSLHMRSVWTSADAKHSVIYPLDIVKTRIQALPSSVLDRSVADTPLGSDRKDPQTIPETVRKHPQSLPRILLRRLRRWQMLSLLLQIVQTEGVAGAFKGFSASMINTFSTRTFPPSPLPLRIALSILPHQLSFDAPRFPDRSCDPQSSHTFSFTPSSEPPPSAVSPSVPLLQNHPSQRRPSSSSAQQQVRLLKSSPSPLPSSPLASSSTFLLHLTPHSPRHPSSRPPPRSSLPPASPVYGPG